MYPLTAALSIIEQLDLTGERAWIGEAPPHQPAFVACDLHRLPGFRPALEHFGRYDSVWVVQDTLSIQGWRILLDSCIRMLKAQGTLVVRYLQNQHLSIPALKSFLFRKYGMRVDVSAEIIDSGEFVTAFYIERDAATLPTDKHWTFGILTQGKKVDLIERFCRSVREFGGPGHEILIVGPRHALYEPYHPTYINKTYSSTLSDICVKKNDIVAGAQHENVCILHDRYILNHDFFTGFDEFGYDFDYLTIRQHHASGKIYPSYCGMQDWGDLIWAPIFECGNENETWACHYLNGGLVVGKRALLRAVPFNPLIFHNQAEDVELAKVMRSRSIVPRINRLSSAVTDVADHLTDAFAYAAHPWEAAEKPAASSQQASLPEAVQLASEPMSLSAPESKPETAAFPTATEGTAAPWRRVKGVARRVRNLRRDGKSWFGVVNTAARFVHRRLVGRPRSADLVPSPGVAASSAASVTISLAHDEVRPVPALKRRPHAREGYNILLYVADSGGVLNVTAHYMRRLQREGSPFCIVAIERVAHASALPADLAPYVVEAPVYPCNIWCIGFPFVSHHFDVHSAWVEGRWNINFTHWELPYVPQRLTANFAALDGLMVTSEFVRDALAGVTSLPIELVDPQVRVDAAVVAKYGREYFSLPGDKRLFLLNWEYTSSTIRKNPVAGMRAFEAAFAGIEDDVALVMHVKIGNANPSDQNIQRDYERFLQRVRTEHPQVIIIERRNMAYDEALGLKGACDCYVSLHRSEGYGMGCAEALAMGRFCLMTGWSGNMQLLENPAWQKRIVTVAVALVPVKPEEFPWVDEDDEVFQLWADVRPGDAVKKMRDVYALMLDHEPARADVA